MRLNPQSRYLRRLLTNSSSSRRWYSLEYAANPRFLQSSETCRSPSPERLSLMVKST